MGQRYIEPQGLTIIRNLTTGDSANIIFKERQWGGNTSNSIEASIKDKEGVERYKITGKYTECLTATDLSNDKSWTIFTPPAKLPDYEKMFHMNIFGL